MYMFLILEQISVELYPSAGMGATSLTFKAAILAAQPFYIRPWSPYAGVVLTGSGLCSWLFLPFSDLP
jgi:hypothetical protein